MIKIWLYGNAGLTLAMVSVGGLTRLTESGLSITEWRPLAGAVPPLSRASWEEEFDRYKASPEYRQLRDPSSFDLSSFQRIYAWEWGHRALGRLIGLTYGIPFLYWAARGRLRGPLLFQTGALLLLGGMQGAIGWWMVRSGLDDSLQHPRVNEYRLATHLGSALVIFSSLMWLGLNQSTSSRPPLPGRLPPWFRLVGGGTVAAVFVTAISGALVAGRDAGLIYNDTLVIPASEREHDLDARVQWRHRLVATSTAVGLIGAAVAARRIGGSSLSRRTVRICYGLAGMTLVQTTLGVATLWSLVKTEVAALHQTGSVLLLTAALHFAHDIGRIVRRIH